MIVKPLLVERVVAVLALNPWNCGMTLAGVDGWSGPGRSGQGDCSAEQSQSHCLRWRCLLVFMTPLIVFSLYIELLYTVLDSGAPRVTLLGIQVPDKLHLLRSLATSFHHRFCPPAECFPSAGAHTRSCLGSQSSGIYERCLRK